jgi:hypothetical protein
MELYDKQIQSIVKSLKTECYIWFAALVLLTAMCFILGPELVRSRDTLAISFQTLLLLVMLTGLPGTFIWFRNRMKKLVTVSDIPLRLSRYEMFARIRQAIFFLFGAMILVIQVFTIMKGAPMLLLVVVVLAFFILPSRARLMMEAGLLKTEEEVEEDEEDMGSE